MVGWCKGRGLRSLSSGFLRIDRFVPVYNAVGWCLCKDWCPWHIGAYRAGWSLFMIKVVGWCKGELELTEDWCHVHRLMPML